MANKIPDINLRGIRATIPGGFIVGRLGKGAGRLELIPISRLRTLSLLPETNPTLSSLVGGTLTGRHGQSYRLHGRGTARWDDRRCSLCDRRCSFPGLSGQRGRRRGRCNSCVFQWVQLGQSLSLTCSGHVRYKAHSKQKETFVHKALAFTVVEENIVHHGGNLAAVTFPWIAYLSGLSMIMVFASTTLGVCWYIALFVDRYRRIQKEKRDAED